MLALLMPCVAYRMCLLAWLSSYCSAVHSTCFAAADDNAPPGAKTRWLATFYLCIPVGYALVTMPWISKAKPWTQSSCPDNNAMPAAESSHRSCCGLKLQC